MNEPLISVIIVNYNGYKWLNDCLSSLTKQTYNNFEIIFVDNNSSDNSISFVKSRFPKVKIVKSDVNLGFAGGNNLGYKKSKGDYIVLLNNDTHVEKNYLKNLVKAFNENEKIAVVQSKIILMDKNELDTCGGFWTSTSFLYYYGNYKDPSLPIYNKPFPVFTVKAASVMIKKEIIEKAGLFDEDFWSYYEETDFCHRVWLAGYECWYWPNAVCHHAMGGTSLVNFDKSYIQFHNFKNKLLSMLKNFDLISLLRIIPTFILLNIMISFYWLIKGKMKYFFSIYKAFYWNLRNLNQTLVKRKDIQKLRTASDKLIFSICKKHPRYIYYYYLLNDKMAYYADNIL